jgi:D-proline reductase (dithiol) PrdB
VCNQSVGLAARFLEAHGLPTMCLSIFRQLTERVRPPRAAWVNHPYGAPWGPPGADEEHRRLVEEVLGWFERIESPGQIVDVASTPGFEADEEGLCRVHWAP